MLLRRVSTVAATIIVLSGISALAQPNLLLSQVVAQNFTNSPRPQPKASGWLQELNLTPQQLQQIRAIRNQSKDQLAQKRQAVLQAQQELEALMAGTASKDQVRDKYNQLKLLRDQYIDAQFEITLATREVLNVQQRQRFTAHIYKQ
jgi:Spy/CpxP family protein refolding chaperone